MINKKILAASVAAICSFNASAVIDLDRAASNLIYSSESVTAAAKVITADAALDIQANIGQNLALTGGADPLVRVAFTNATFTAGVSKTSFKLEQLLPLHLLLMEQLILVLQALVKFLMVLLVVILWLFLMPTQL